MLIITNTNKELFLKEVNKYLSNGHKLVGDIEIEMIDGRYHKFQYTATLKVP